MVRRFENCPICGKFMKIYELKILTAEDGIEFLEEGVEVRCSKCGYQSFWPKKGGP